MQTVLLIEMPMGTGVEGVWVVLEVSSIGDANVVFRVWATVKLIQMRLR